MWYSLVLLGYKPVQHVTVLNNVSNCNTIILYYNFMGPPSYLWSVVERNVDMRRIPVLANFNLLTPNVNYSGRTAPLTSKVEFRYLFNKYRY